VNACAPEPFVSVDDLEHQAHAADVAISEGVRPLTDQGGEHVAKVVRLAVGCEQREPAAREHGQVADELERLAADAGLVRPGLEQTQHTPSIRPRRSPSSAAPGGRRPIGWLQAARRERTHGWRALCGFRALVVCH
jgi:hypothetical protein